MLLRSQENLSVNQEVQLQELLDANHSLTSVYVSKKALKASWYAPSVKEGANKSYGTRAFTGNPLILND
ncbi:hypothetical protein C1C92_22450 [Aeromonas caviae]|nr:hypothetical protein C1C92_22450 [Aeromonas caviae]